MRRQIVEMREALQSIRTSERRGKWARVLGLMGGICIVLFFVLQFIRLGQSVWQSDEIGELAKARVKQLNLQTWPKTILEEAGPTCVKETGRVLEDTEVLTTAKQELQILITDLKPILIDSFTRIQPRLSQDIENEKEKTAEELRDRITDVLRSRMRATLEKHRGEIEQRLGLSRAQGDEVLLNLINASNTAMRSIVERRWGRNTQDLHEISEYLARFPNPPRLSEDEMITEATRVLIALARHKLPDYDPEVEDRKNRLPDSILLEEVNEQ
ncbi:MAG: hypothetical protein HYY93_14970 [Planctomycetes bacterium]|nr:hypothetical protein [Planctomycetota bacterium]